MVQDRNAARHTKIAGTWSQPARSAGSTYAAETTTEPARLHWPEGRLGARTTEPHPCYASRPSIPGLVTHDAAVAVWARSRRHMLSVRPQRYYDRPLMDSRAGWLVCVLWRGSMRAAGAEGNGR